MSSFLRCRHAASPTPLSHSALAITITDLVAEYTLTHTFRNAHDVPIEVVYSFPLPLDAAFLGLRATLAGETVEATVLARTKAERRYDDAISGGDSAVLLSTPEPGLLCVTLGSLKPGEAGEIVLRFAAPLRVADGCARLGLPLTQRPRYGHWRLDALHEPQHDFATEHPLTLTVNVRGLLAAARAHCPSHPARFKRDDSGQALHLATAQLDRDVVLAFELDADLAPSARAIADGDDTFGLASFIVPADDEAQPLDLVLLLDGSGSMRGDAIAQSRAALHALVQALTPADRIQVIRFGSTARPLFRRPLGATAQVTAALRELAATITADLGGTEMGDALQLALHQLPAAEAARRRALILVTDGAVQPADLADASAALTRANVPTFVVTVGSSAGVEVLQPLAEATHASLERAVPMEPIDACAMRLLRRARCAPVALQAHWLGVDDAQPIALPPAFPGDVATVAAHWSGQAPARVRIEAPQWPAPIEMELAQRIADAAQRALLGQRRHALAEHGQRTALALRYGLLTDGTSAVLVKRRTEADRIDTLQHIIKVPLMLPDGMLTSATCASSDDYLSIPAFLRRQVAPAVNVPHDVVMEREAPIVRMRPLSATRVGELVSALRAALRTTWLGDPAECIDPDAATARQSADLRPDLLALLDGLGLQRQRGHEVAALTLLFAMLALADAPRLSDAEEARLALLQPRLREADLEPETLITAITDAMHNGIGYGMCVEPVHAA